MAFSWQRGVGSVDSHRQRIWCYRCVPNAEALVISPYPEQDYYNVAAAIVASLDFLVAGDVVLIEQQTSAFDAYCPIEYIPSVFDAIQWLVAEEISVVEPSANGRS